MNKIEQKPSSRRSHFEKFSDFVFAKTGLPLPRLLMIVFGLLLLTASILYATRDDDTPSQLNTQESETIDFLEAVTLPADFSKSSFPVQLEKLDQMTERCSHYLSQNNDYSVGAQEKLLAPFALKTMTLSDNGLDPLPSLELLQKNVDQISNSSTQKDAHQYLLVGTYVKVLAESPEIDCYAQAMAAISAIRETTPVPRHRAVFSFNSAMTYYKKSQDKIKSGKLVTLLGDRLSIAQEQEISDFGFSLIDFPNYVNCYEGSINQSKFKDESETNTTELMNQIKETPPRSMRTYEVLMNVPEEHLQSGKKQVALKVLNQLVSAASSSAPHIRDSVLEKLAKQKTRIDLLSSRFPLTGFDMAGRTIGSPEKEQTQIVFFDPYDKRSKNALLRVLNSPVREVSSTTTYLASASELSADELLKVENEYPTFIVVDGPTSKDWLEKSGVDRMPYLIRLGKEGVVERLSFP